MNNTNTTLGIDNLGLSSEVSANLKKYNSAIDGALDAVQKLESICITAKLAEMFGADNTQTADAMKQDYLVAT
jgi:hypothetical protein